MATKLPMYKSPVFKSAAYIALINAVLFIPLLIIAIVAGLLDGIGNTFIFQASYNFILILFELPSIFVLWVLGKVVQPKGIIWPIRVLIGLSVLGVFHAIGEYLMPVEWTDAWLRLLWTIAITTVLANFSLALRIINKRSGSWEVNLFYPFALLTLIGSLLTATVILLPLALLCWLAASFLLAAAFFKLTKGQAPDKPVLHQEVSISIPYLMFASSALALLSAFLLLGITYGLCGISSAIGEQHIESLLLTALIVQAALTAYVFPRRFATPSLRLTLLLSLVVALFLAISYENPSLLQSQSNDPGIFNNLATLVTSTVTRYVLSVLLGIGLSFCAFSILNQKDDLFGYRQALGGSYLLLSLGFVTLVADTFRVIGLSVAAISLIGIALAMLSQQRRTWFILDSKRKRQVFLGATILAPVTIYLGYFTLSALIVINEIDWPQSDQTKMETIPANSPSLVQPSALLKHQHILLSDTWFFDGHTGVGVKNRTLYQTQDMGTHWEKLNSLPVDADFIRFDRSGVKGVAGSLWGPVALTSDGGKTWRTLDLIEVFEKTSQRKFGAFLLDETSAIHLDPETGYGAFSAGCRFFYTEDFGQNWKMKAFEKGSDGHWCPTDSPFAWRPDHKLLIATTLGSEMMLQYNKQTHLWDNVCSVDSESFLLGGGDQCDSKVELTQAQKRFYELYNQSSAAFHTQVTEEIIDSIIHGNTPDLTEAGDSHCHNDAIEWLVDNHFLAVKTHAEKTWQVLTYMPELTDIHPMSALKAFGWIDGAEPYTTSDGGRIWSPLFSAEEMERFGYLVHYQYTSAGNGLWVLFEKQVVYVDLTDGTHRSIKDLSDETTQFDRIGLSENNEIIWLINMDREQLLLTQDNGLHWQRLPLNEVPDAATDNDSPPFLTGLSCESKNRACFLLFDSGTLFQLDLNMIEKSDSIRRIAQLPAELDLDGAIFITHATDGQFLFLPAYGDRFYLSDDQGQTWVENKLSVKSDWRDVQQASDGYLLIGSEEAIFVNKSGTTLTVFDPEEWEAEIFLCVNSEDNTMYAYNHDTLAVSLDGGKQWRRKDFVDAPPFCGMHNGFLWLKGDSLTTYQQQP